MKAIWKAAACILGMALCLPSLASSVRLSGSTVYVNESPVITIRHGSAEKRTKTALRILKAHNDKPNARAIPQGGKAAILIGKSTLLRVEPEDAAAARSTPIDLAKLWATNINKALMLNPIQLGSTNVLMGNGKDVNVPLMGKYSLSATVESSDESIVKVKRIPGNIVLSGKLAGSTQVVVSGAGQTLTIAVRVIPMAALFPQYASATVTGLPATGSMTKGAVEAAVWNQVNLAPSADIKFVVPEIGQIPVGEARIVPVKVSATAPESLPNEGTVFVTLRNTPRFVNPESELWYDNIPESIDKMGQLFGGKISAKQSVRVLYHHDNDSPRGVLFHSQILNTSDKPAQVLLIPGDSPSDLNPVLAGVEAADRFFRNWLASSGEIVTIPARGTLPIALRRLAPKETVSGLIYMSLLDGGPDSVMVRSDAKVPFPVEGRWAKALEHDYPWRVIGPQPIRGDDALSSLVSEHVFPQPFRNLDVTYAVGGRHGFVRIGQEPIASASGDRYLDGNFGVVYSIRAYVENPTSAPAEVEMVFEASAGYAGALFAVNGTVVSGPMLKPKGEARILKMRLEAGQSRTFLVQTIPHSGGSYPATLALRPIDQTAKFNAGAGKSRK